ncbi:MAG TPA: helix-turn-helix domain-containing protein [Pseudonocardiaceae bacterium]|jgi:transcriptional regulator with XRE-family HTH domain
MDGTGEQRFAELLRAHRTRRRMTQQQLADLSTVSVRAISDLEAGRARRPRRDTVRLIADGLRLTGRPRLDFESAAHCSVDLDDVTLGDPVASAAPPAPADDTIGREEQVAALTELLGVDGQRLTTIIGLPGVGKSRVALDVAGALHRDLNFPVLWSADDGGTAHRLAGLVRPAVCGSDAGAGVVLAALAAVVDSRPALLVLDGDRRDRPEPDRVLSLLRDCPALRILATARAPLGVFGERVVPLPPLPVPAAGQVDIVSVPSVRLLLRHVRRVRPGFTMNAAVAPIVAALCRAVDGLPAALEAVADWLLLYDVDQLLDLVRVDPFVVLDHRPGDDLRTRLCAVRRELTTDEATLLDHVTALGTGWTVASAAAATGLPVPHCSRVVRGLVVRGLVAAGERAGFRALELVRALFAAPAGAV